MCSPERRRHWLFFRAHLLLSSDSISSVPELDKRERTCLVSSFSESKIWYFESGVLVFVRLVDKNIFRLNICYGISRESNFFMLDLANYSDKPFIHTEGNAICRLNLATCDLSQRDLPKVSHFSKGVKSSFIVITFTKCTLIGNLVE